MGGEGGGGSAILCSAGAATSAGSPEEAVLPVSRAAGSEGRDSREGVAVRLPEATLDPGALPVCRRRSAAGEGNGAGLCGARWTPERLRTKNAAAQAASPIPAAARIRPVLRRGAVSRGFSNACFSSFPRSGVNGIVVVTAASDAAADGASMTEGGAAAGMSEGGCAPLVPIRMASSRSALLRAFLSRFEPRARPRLGCSPVSAIRAGSEPVVPGAGSSGAEAASAAAGEACSVAAVASMPREGSRGGTAKSGTVSSLAIGPFGRSGCAGGSSCPDRTGAITGETVTDAGVGAACAGSGGPFPRQGPNRSSSRLRLRGAPSRGRPPSRHGP